MKRFLLVLVTLSLFVTCAFAEGVDLEGMATDELVALRDAVNAELAKRNFAEREVLVPAGTYIIGEDIPAGNYTFLCNDDIIQIEIQGAGVYTGHVLTKGETVGKQPLENGWTITISYGSVVFTPYVGLGF